MSLAPCSIQDGCGEFKLVPGGTSTASQSSTRSSISSVQSEGWEGSEEGGESVDGEEEEEAASLWELVEKDEAQISEEEGQSTLVYRSCNGNPNKDRT